MFDNPNRVVTNLFESERFRMAVLAAINNTMANIDCTLDALKVPGFLGYTPPFGTKVTGSITPRNNNNNALMPFGFQRPKVVTETSATTQIQANIVFEIVAGGITLTLGNAAFTGCRVSAINSVNTDATVKFAATSGANITARAHESVHIDGCQ
jgi:hypothetical protein